VTAPFRVAFVPGVTPDKWARAWRERSTVPLELMPIEQTEQERVLREAEADMCFLRLPIDREGLHCIPLYDEVPVVVVPLEHPVAAYDEISLVELSDEQLVWGAVPEWQPTTAQLDWPAMSAKDAIEVVASGTGIVIAPMSIARLHHRKDVVHRPVTGVPTTKVGLAWLVARDDTDTQAFVGIVRGRGANSSR
jgi:DNA-binding transcriptional LysR family regulator